MLSLISRLHAILADTLLLYAAVLGAWGTWQLFRRQAISPGLRAGFLLMIGLTAVQGLAGILAYLVGGHPRETLHIVYGIFAIGFLPGVVVFATGGLRGARGTALREAAILTASCWIVAIAFGRGITTGG